MANYQCRRMQGKVFPVWGCRRPCLVARLRAPPRTWRPTVRWGARGVAPGSGVVGGGVGVGFTVRASKPSCWADYASVTAGRTPGVTDWDLRRSVVWLSNHWRLVGMIRAVVAGLPPQAHRHGCGGGGHLARPRRGAGGHMVCTTTALRGWLCLLLS
jgi:hypothetical protein